MVRGNIAVVGVSGADFTDVPRKNVPYHVAGHHQVVALGVRHADLPTPTIAADKSKAGGKARLGVMMPFFDEVLEHRWAAVSLRF